MRHRFTVSFLSAILVSACADPSSETTDVGSTLQGTSSTTGDLPTSGGVDSGTTGGENPCLTPSDDTVVQIVADTTVCPGTYNDVRFEIESADGITLTGKDVTIYNTNFYDIVRVSKSTNVNVNGFNVVGSRAVNFYETSKSTIEDIRVTSADEEQPAIRLDGAAQNLIKQVSVEGLGSHVYVIPSGGAGSAEEGPDNVFQDCEFHNPGSGDTSENCIFRCGIWLTTNRNELRSSKIDKVLVLVTGSSDNIINNNEIHGVPGSECIGIGSEDSSQNEVTQNQISDCATGIIISDDATGNIVQDNNISVTEACVEESLMGGNTIDPNDCTIV